MSGMQWCQLSVNLAIHSPLGKQKVLLGQQDQPPYLSVHLPLPCTPQTAAPSLCLHQARLNLTCLHLPRIHRSLYCRQAPPHASAVSFDFQWQHSFRNEPPGFKHQPFQFLAGCLRPVPQPLCDSASSPIKWE